MFSKLYYNNDKAYLINRTMPIHNFERDGKLNMEIVKECRDWLECDHVLKTKTHFLFVVTVEDVDFDEVIEDDDIKPLKPTK